MSAELITLASKFFIRLCPIENSSRCFYHFFSAPHLGVASNLQFTRTKHTHKTEKEKEKENNTWTGCQFIQVTGQLGHCVCVTHKTLCWSIKLAIAVGLVRITLTHREWVMMSIRPVENRASVALLHDPVLYFVQLLPCAVIFCCSFLLHKKYNSCFYSLNVLTLRTYARERKVVLSLDYKNKKVGSK